MDPTYGPPPFHFPGPVITIPIGEGGDVVNPKLQAIFQSLGVPHFLWGRCDTGLRNVYHQLGKQAFEQMMQDGVQAIEAEEGTAVQDVLSQHAPSPVAPAEGQGG